MLHGLLIDPQQESFIQRQEQLAEAGPNPAPQGAGATGRPTSAASSFNSGSQQIATQGWHHGFQVQSKGTRGLDVLPKYWHNSDERTTESESEGPLVSKVALLVMGFCCA